MTTVTASIVGWLDAVEPVARGLRFLASRILRDEWKVSELAEASVHMLSRRYGERLGESPGDQIFVDARWRALDMAVGGRRARVLRDIEFDGEALEDIPDASDLAREFENRDLVARLERLLTESGRYDRAELLRVIQLYRLDLHDELSGAFGIPEGRAGYQPKNTLKKRFRRIMRRFLEELSDSQDKEHAARTGSKRTHHNFSRIPHQRVRAA